MEYVALKTCEEVGELASAVLGLVGTNSATTGKGDVAGEAADVVICIMVLLDRWYPVSLFAAVEAKLAILNDLNSGRQPVATHDPGCATSSGVDCDCGQRLAACGYDAGQVMTAAQSHTSPPTPGEPPTTGVQGQPPATGVQGQGLVSGAGATGR